MRYFWLLLILIFINSCVYVTIDYVEEYKGNIFKYLSINDHTKNCNFYIGLQETKLNDSLAVISYFEFKNFKQEKPKIIKINYDFYQDDKCLNKIDVDSALILQTMEVNDSTTFFDEKARKGDYYIYNHRIHYDLKSAISGNFFFKGSIILENNGEKINYSFLEKINLYKIEKVEAFKKEGNN